LTIAAGGALLAPPAVVERSPTITTVSLLPALAKETLLSRDARRLLWELGKQAVEQPWPFLMAAAPIYRSRQLVGVPWFGWAITPLLVYREWSQWPSNRWWDPPLDWAFLSLGVVVVTWRRRGRGRAPAPQSSPRPPSHPLRRKYASSPPATASIRARAIG
jgi:hypothetical protein